MRRSVRYLAFGVLLGLGAPAGLLLMHAIVLHVFPMPSWIAAEVTTHTLDYLYLTVSTASVFAIMGLILANREELLIASAQTDPLTGLANRRHLMTRIADELARATRYQSPLSLLIVDVDHLKPINDGAGHAAGDLAIRDVARAIAGSCRVTDIAARYGGDEFMVIAPNTAATAGVELAERIRNAVKERTDGTVSVSIGVADLAEAPAPEALALCAVADQALYRAKSAGRDRVARAATA